MNAYASAARAEQAKPIHIGEHLRGWRQRRHLSQLDLAGEADISARHLSFVETGRSAPSREMVLKLAERLDVPLRERSEEHTSELQSLRHLVCRLLLEKKKQ